MENEVHAYYGNRTRVRVCGLCQTEDKLLLINHRSLTSTNFWAPPGGGLNFAEPAADSLKREFIEETGLTVEVDNFLFACELIKHPLHAIELFFKIKPLSGQLITGTDPEPGSPKIILEAKFMLWEEILALPADQIHGIFSKVDHPSKVALLSGYFKL